MIGAAATLMKSLYWSVVAMKELNQKAKLYLQVNLCSNSQIWSWTLGHFGCFLSRVVANDSVLVVGTCIGRVNLLVYTVGIQRSGGHSESGHVVGWW